MSSNTDEAVSLLTSTSQPCHHFSIAEIQSATNDFDDELVIGEGGFGKVYKCHICIEETSHVVAVKRLDSMSNQGAPEFRAEIEMLSKLRHRHLVSLIGFCDDNKEMILVYEYMPHGTLYHHLHKADTPLNWMQRLKIAIGAAHGLNYLHTGVGTQHGVIHRDIKSSNILLDENWAAMIADFGLSKVGPINQSFSYVYTDVKGTFGYLDPEYFYTRRLTRKTDVFAFGVVLFELLSGRRAVETRYGDEECSLVRWAQKCVKDRKLYQLVDYNIRGTIFAKFLTRFSQLAYRCVHSVPKERPSMTEVVASLQLLLELQEKRENSADSSAKTWFTWKIHKYFVPTTKQNSDQSGTSPQKSHSIKMGEMAPQHGELLGVTRDLKKHTYIKMQYATRNFGNDTRLGEMAPQLGELLGVTRDLKKFTYVELQYATRNFGNDTCLVHRGVVEVFKGWVDKTTYCPSNEDTGLPIAVKRFCHYKNLDLDVLKELSDHPNLVKLIGCCLRFKEVFLVYEFMPLGNFEDCLYTGILLGLPLVKKAKIAVGIARGMVFLQKKQDEVSESMFHRRSTVSESWFDRHKAFLDKESKNYTNDDYDPYDPWSRYQPFQPLSYDIWMQTVIEYELDRRKILLDEGFTAKLSNYEGAGRQQDNQRGGNDMLGCEPSTLRNDVFGFAVVLTEVVIGRKICNEDFYEIEDLLSRCANYSLCHVAKLCIQICNEVDAELNMITRLEEYEKHIPRMRSLCKK